MENGRDFLRSQVGNAVVQHRTLLQSLEDHARLTNDARIRQLCGAQVGGMQRHQAKLESYQRTLGRESGAAVTSLHPAVAPQHDYPRLVEEIVLARQVEETFKTFRDAGRELGEMELAWIGEEGERAMDRYVEAASRLVQKLFVELAQEVPIGIRRTSQTLRRTDGEEVGRDLGASSAR